MKKISVKKNHILILIIAVAIIAGGFLLITKERFEPEKVDIKYLESMQLNPPKDYIKKLKLVVEKNKDPYTRERAIFTLTDITIRKYETEKIIDFLKEIALNEKEDNVRSAAYANIDLIRDYYPLERQGSLELSILGEIKKGSQIKLIAKISSKIDVEEVIIGIDYLPKDIEWLSQPYHKIALKANEPKEIEFDLLLRKIGEYEIPVTLMMSFDKIDYEEIEKEIRIKVGEFSGEVISEEELGF